MFKTLEKVGSQVQEILNTNPKLQALMTHLQLLAVEKNLTTEQWDELKNRLFQNAVIYILMNDKGLREQLGGEVYDALRNQA